MVRVRIVIEGGGSGETPDKDFRQAWTQFFESAGLVGRMPRVVRGEGRQQTLDKFRTALQSQRRNEVVILLVDSEGPVVPGRSAWEHLHNQDNWVQPPGAANDSAFLMVQVMETWFLADRGTLRQFFGSALNENHFRQWLDLEAVPKDTVIDALERATANCQKPYSKGRVSFGLLGRIDPVRVANSCPHANYLLHYLRSL
jgi:hypothetical protein